MEFSDDISCSLAEIRTRLSAPICLTILEIQKHQVSKCRSIEWISNLECLSIPPRHGRKRRYGDGREFIEVEPLRETVLLRRRINPLQNKEMEYIAVSWVWKPGPKEEETFERYVIESREDEKQHGQQPMIRSPVRDIVLDRVIKYANCHDKKLFWIDGICINQDDNEEVEVATQTMDLVYSLSKRSLAIINSNIGTEEELNLLTKLMEGKYVNASGTLRIVDQASRVLELIRCLTSASWWTRAWTFQEDYKASVKMTLLISHKASLEQLKRSSGIFGSVLGELCVKSVDFRTVVTKFCQAYKQEIGSDQDSMKLCDEILERAGKYTILLCERAEDGGDVIRKPMSPIVLADIKARQVTQSWDRLAIVANCCNYDVRLNAHELKNREFSQSLAFLTQYLLNGEIVKNEQSGNPLATESVFDFLKHRSLDSFKSPIKTQLSFIKSCRLPKVELVSKGIQTSGHLWKLGKRIEAKCEAKLPGEDSTFDGLEGYERYLLKQLAHELRTGIHGRSYENLAKDLLHYLDEEKEAKGGFVDKYMYWMASEVCCATTDPRQVLRLGCLVSGSRNEYAPYSGIFVCDANDQGPDYVFTAYEASGEIDKYVSLGVEFLNPDKQELPELITKKWMNGLYFASRRDKREVLLPWPDCLNV